MTFNFNKIVVDGMRPKVEPKPWMREKKFTLVQNIDHLNEVVDAAIAAGLCALDIETTGLDSRIDESRKTKDSVVGYCLSYDGEEGFYVPVGHYTTKDGDRTTHPLNLPPFEVGKVIKRLSEGCTLIFHNAAFDLEFLYGLGVTIDIDIDKASDFEDTLILDYLRDSTDKRHGLKHLSERFLGMEMIEIHDLFRTGTKDRDFSTLDPDRPEVLWYTGSDAICTYLLFDFYCRHAPDVKDYPENLKGPQYEYKSSHTIYGEQSRVYKIEKAMIPALRWMERNRPLIDIDYVRNLKEECEALIKDSIREIEEEIFNNIRDPNIRDLYTFRTLYDVTSPQQLGKALEKLKQTNPAFRGMEFEVTEKSGQIKTDAGAIDIMVSRYGDTFPFLSKIQVFRSLQKALGTYIMPLYVNTDWEGNPEGPRNKINDSTIRFSFLPHRVDTGRFAASKGSPEHGFSGINVQSTPGTYNYASFEVREIYKRPKGEGAPGYPFVEGYARAVLERGFLRQVRDRHFIRDMKTGAEYCIRKDCVGCPFIDRCDHSEPFKKTFLSLESAIRPALVARPGYVIVACDFSGVELRVAANISEEPQWIREFYRCGTCGHEFQSPTKKEARASRISGHHNWEINERPPSHCPSCGSDKIGDLHTLTAKIIYGDDVTELSPSEFSQRRQASKASNFAIIYGGGGGAIARATGESFEQGRLIRDRILQNLKAFGQWMGTVIKEARHRKYVSTAIGRRIRLHEINSPEGWIRAKQERNAVNSIVQGSATGDLIKYAMGSIYRQCRERGWLSDVKMILTIHDELVFEIRQDLLDEALPVITECMTEFGDLMKWPIPLITDTEFGEYWGDSHNWREIHDVNVSTGLTDAPVPLYLVDKIKFTPGMWYEDESGVRYVWTNEKEGSPGFVSMPTYKMLLKENAKDTEEDESGPGTHTTTAGSSPAPGAEDSPEPEEGSPERIQEKESYDISTLVPGASADAVSALPVYTHHIQYTLSTASSMHSYMLRLKKIQSTFVSLRKLREVLPTHVLVVKTLDGSSIVSPENNFLIDPKIFRILAFYEGI